MRFLILNRKTGLPIEGVKAKAYYDEYDYNNTNNSYGNYNNSNNDKDNWKISRLTAKFVKNEYDPRFDYDKLQSNDR